MHFGSRNERKLKDESENYSIQFENKNKVSNVVDAYILRKFYGDHGGFAIVYGPKCWTVFQKLQNINTYFFTKHFNKN